jgi:rare lipoprotein A
MRLIQQLILVILVVGTAMAQDFPIPDSGYASWYGEEHRGKVMANGRKFDPDQLTAASWFYPLGTRVRVTLASDFGDSSGVVVTITDRGPAKRLVLGGRIIDLTHEAFKRLAPDRVGVISVRVCLVP